MPADRLVVGDIQIVELGAAVVADQPRLLLEMLGLEIDQGRGAVAMRLLAARHQRLAELAAQAFTAIQA
ncbi:hypothetical protein D3C84_1298460 [compost metagenome]